ncbi:MAG: deoxyguanosinetriphosphate triphosphohydrolase [Eubacteriales bacterium]|nr:deoxyguanosinetriphosphate triphosphohydrolase [Eubacteriales bacterium]
MNIREMAEKREKEFFSPYAAFSQNSRGREREEKPCDIRPVYQRDRDRIMHSKAFRRLKQKTQVFLSPVGDHYRTRMMHTLEVAQTARTIAKALRLNDDLAEAIALGHDLGHTPFGHCGEYALNEIAPCGFAHYEQSVRIVELLEKGGEGLNLTWEVRDGIKNHRTTGNPSTLEGKIVRISDKVAYLNSDIDDAKRAKILTEEEIPKAYREVLGNTTRERLNTLIHDIIINSMDRNEIAMSPEISLVMKDLRMFMFEHVYDDPCTKKEEKKAIGLVQALYEYYIIHTDLLPQEYRSLMDKKGQPKERVVCDYIAGMTDSYATQKFTELFIPKFWQL